MNLIKKIESAEKKYRQILEDYFIKTWGDTALFSHGIGHHRRVWHYAKELLTEAGKNGKTRISVSPDKLLVACYLHDIGMTIDISERHGIHSSNFCREFISINGLSESEFSQVFNAIENHDKKEYTFKDNSINLETLLTIADDLDAFGYTGIYRYAEIYLLRKIDPLLIGEKVRQNIRCRFITLKKIFGNYPEILLRHKARFNITDDFFKNYSNQVQKHNFKSDKPEGYCGVIEIISDIVNCNTTFDEIVKNKEIFINDIIISTFINRIYEIK
jgi:HD superfamily phosphodiesterase